jgi:hypothetical protein
VDNDGEMGIGQAPVQTVDEIYQLLWTAVASKRPVAALYRGRPRLFCPHRLGRNRQGQLRVLCYQYGGESKSGLAAAGSPGNWRCVELERLGHVKLLDDEWWTAPNHSRPSSCVTDADVDAENLLPHHLGRDPQQGH